LRWLGGQTHPDRHLAAIGEKRHCPLVVAQHTVAMRVAAVTEMIATVPRRMAVLEAPNKATKILEAPAALGSFKYVMIWHPRMQTDAAHVWLRSIVRELGRQLS
jgi:DNA-binding transcriptional LysR family regulator